MASTQQHVGELVARLFPGSALEPLAPDTGGDDTHKVTGYGRPLRGPQGTPRVLVFRTAPRTCSATTGAATAPAESSSRASMWRLASPR